MKKSKEIKSHVVLPVSVFRDHISECLDLCVGGGRVFIDRAGTHYLLICVGDAMRVNDINIMSDIIKEHTVCGVTDMNAILETGVKEHWVLPAPADSKEPVVAQKKDKKVAAVALREAEKKLGVEPVKFHSYF